MNKRNEVLTQAEQIRAQYIITDIIVKSFNKLKRDLKSDWHKFSYNTAKNMEGIVEDVIYRQCNKILTASKIKINSHKLIEEIKRRRKEARSHLADELRASRKTLRELHWKIKYAEIEANRLVKEKEILMRKDVAQRLISGREKLKRLKENYDNLSKSWSTRDYRDYSINEYPSIPLPHSAPDNIGSGLPSTAGVYFLWDKDEIVYVGQAKRLCERVRLGSHHVLTEEHKISFVFVKYNELNWAESYYIGVAKPKLNFGKRSTYGKGDE